MGNDTSEQCVKCVQIRNFFWSVFSCIRTEYCDLWCKYPHSVRIQENTGHKKLRIWTLFTSWRHHAEIKEGALVPDPFFKKKKTFYEVKASFGRILFEHTTKVNCIKF